MGYTTNFTGHFRLDKQLTLDHFQILNKFAETDHRTEDYIGDDFSYYCQWKPTKDGWSIEWDGGEKFYSYVEWLEYIIENFLKIWGYTLDGEVQYSGEEVGDCGVLLVKGNVVSKQKYNPDTDDVTSLVKKGLEDDETRGFWYLKKIMERS